jgi:hypothetical protein
VSNYIWAIKHNQEHWGEAMLYCYARTAYRDARKQLAAGSDIDVYRLLSTHDGNPMPSTKVGREEYS